MRRSGTRRDPALFRLGAAEDRQERRSICAAAGVATVATLIAHLKSAGARLCRRLRRSQPHCASRSISDHAGFDAPIGAGDEIAFFPPVTGGDMKTRIRIQREDFDLGAEAGRR